MLEGCQKLEPVCTYFSSLAIRERILLWRYAYLKIAKKSLQRWLLICPVNSFMLRKQLVNSHRLVQTTDYHNCGFYVNLNYDEKKWLHKRHWKLHLKLSIFCEVCAKCVLRNEWICTFSSFAGHERLLTSEYEG